MYTECIDLLTLSPLHLQISTALGVRVLDVGVVSCQESAITAQEVTAEERCVGGCWVGLVDDFIVVDANSSAVVSPRVVTRGSCGCPAAVIKTTTTFQEQPCSNNTCLNGGRCLSTFSGTR